MRFLVDTNVVLEWVKIRPDPGVITWMADVDEDRVFISVISLAALRRGVERLPAGNRRSRLDAWFQEEVPQRFERANKALLFGRVAIGRRMAENRCYLTPSDPFATACFVANWSPNCFLEVSSKASNTSLANC